MADWVMHVIVRHLLPCVQTVAQSLADLSWMSHRHLLYQLFHKSHLTFLVSS